MGRAATIAQIKSSKSQHAKIIDVILEDPANRKKETQKHSKGKIVSDRKVKQLPLSMIESEMQMNISTIGYDAQALITWMATRIYGELKEMYRDFMSQLFSMVFQLVCLIASSSLQIIRISSSLVARADMYS